MKSKWGRTTGLTVGLIVSRLVLVAMGVVLVQALAVSPALADQTYKPYRGVSWNGKKIYLSPASHGGGEGARAECGNKTEDEMAFFHAYDITEAPYYQDVYSPNHPQRNLRAMGYKIRIGGGTYQQRITRSNRWGSTRHVPLHSNGYRFNDCSNTNAGLFGTMAIYASGSGTGYDLANKIMNRIGAWTGTAQGNVSPGTHDFVCDDPNSGCVNPNVSPLGELHQTKAPAAYIESEYHSWNKGYTWLRDSFRWAWRTAWGIDVHLGNPR